MKIKREQRKKLEGYLKKFYSLYPDEKYTVFHFVKFLKKRLKLKKDAWIGVSGDTSVGKSFFVIMAMILFGRPMSLTDNITYIPKGNEIMQKFNKLKFNTLLIDEAAKQMRSVQWQDKQQQNVNTAAMTERFKNNAVFLNMPNFLEFTKSMKRGNIKFRAIIPYRSDLYARVIIRRKSRNWRSEDAWGDKKANSIYEKYEKKGRGLDNQTILSIERSLPVTVMDFIVPNLELILPDVTETYEELKIKSREIEALSEPGMIKHNIYKSKYQDLLNNITKILYNNELEIGKIKVTKGDIAAALNIGYSTFNTFLKKDRMKQRKITQFRKEQK